VPTNPTPACLNGSEGPCLCTNRRSSSLNQILSLYRRFQPGQYPLIVTAPVNQRRYGRKHTRLSHGRIVGADAPSATSRCGQRRPHVYHLFPVGSRRSSGRGKGDAPFGPVAIPYFVQRIRLPHVKVRYTPSRTGGTARPGPRSRLGGPRQIGTGHDRLARRGPASRPPSRPAAPGSPRRPSATAMPARSAPARTRAGPTKTAACGVHEEPEWRTHAQK